MCDTEQIINELRLNSPDLWDEAITHFSNGKKHNERLGFLGNAVLNLCIADLLYGLFEDKEAKRSKISNYLRSDEVLNEIGRQMGLAEIIKTGPSHGGKVTDSMVAGCLEAIIGAAYKDQGFEKTRAIVEALYRNHKRVELSHESHDPITELNELVEDLQIKVEHESFERTINEDNIFYHTILVDENAAVAWARSKKEAEANASAIMISMLLNREISEDFDSV
jgi:dsRNA-specific ribonuclease